MKKDGGEKHLLLDYLREGKTDDFIYALENGINPKKALVKDPDFYFGAKLDYIIHNEIRNGKGISALEFALYKNKTNAIKKLLSYDSILKFKDKAGNDLLTLAKKLGSKDSIIKIIDDKIKDKYILKSPYI